MKTLRLFLLITLAFASGILLERRGVLRSSPVETPTDGRSLASAIAALTPERPVSDRSEDLPASELEVEVQKRAAYLAALVDEVKRLDRHSGLGAGTDEISAARRKNGLKTPMGGGEIKGHAYYRLGKSLDGVSFLDRPVKNRSKAVVTLSPLLGIDADLAKFASTPVGAPVNGEITSGFGFRDSPFESGRRLHEGIDFAVDPRTPVLSTADGVVTSAGRMSGYGNTVIILHKDGIETLYAHLSRISVAVGTRVCRGQKVGLVGMSGHSTGPHVHYEVRVNGVPRNPMRFVNLGSVVTALAEVPVQKDSELS